MAPPDATIEVAASTLSVRLRAATALLEEIVADRALLAEIAVEDRNRFLQAAGRVSRPDVIDRRRLLKVSKRKRKAERVQREESVLAETGIRRLRRAPVFTTPNYFPPKPDELRVEEPAYREAAEPLNC